MDYHLLLFQFPKKIVCLVVLLKIYLILIVKFLFLFLIVARLNDPSESENLEFLSGQFEGDIVLTFAQRRSIMNPDGINDRYPASRWPNNTVPYALSDDFSKLNFNTY